MYAAFRCPLPLFTVIAQPFLPPPTPTGGLLLRDGSPLGLSTGANISLLIDAIPENYLSLFDGTYLDLSNGQRITVWRIYEPVHLRNKAKLQLSTLATFDLRIPPVMAENNLTLSNGASLTLSDQQNLTL